LIKERDEQIAKDPKDEHLVDFASDEEESESEFQKKLQGDRVKAPFKWTLEHEA